MKKMLLPLACCFLLVGTSTVHAQIQADSVATVTVDENGTPKRLKVGMGFGLNFVGGTNISLAPNLTYQVSKNVSLGGGLQFNYASLKDVQKTTTYGANLLAFYTPFRKALTSLEFAQLRVNQNNTLLNTKTNFWESALFVGAGYQVSPKISFGAKYNVLYDDDESIYSSPIIPFVNIGF